MQATDILSIVPALPPEVNGLGDYGWLLAKQLKETFNQDTVFVRTDNSINPDKNFQVKLLGANTEEKLQEFLESYSPKQLLLHYVGYAYSPNGTPLWLLKGLTQYKRKKPDCKFITVFHELYSSGYPWKKAFWTKPLQKKIALGLHYLSDRSICNTSITHSILEKFQPHKTIFLPVFSNVSEPDHIPAFEERKDQLIIFGNTSLRKRLYQQREELNYWIKNLQIERIIEIGPEIANGNSFASTLPVDYKGILSSKEIVDILLQSKYGILNYPPALLTKSGVFAAYAAHGILPIVTGNNRGSIQDLTIEMSFISRKSTESHDSVIRRNLEWYRSHSLKNTAKIVFKLYNDIETDKRFTNSKK